MVMEINQELVYLLISNQFPQWSNLVIRPVEMSGWDNRTFHLGDDKLVRLPSAENYAGQVEKEQEWLPKLAPFLPNKIPVPLGMGTPNENYPWKWSVYRWIEGKTIASSPEVDLCVLAKDLANFLVALQSVDPKGGPVAGPQSFYRGGSVTVYDSETRHAIRVLNNKINPSLVTEIWEAGCVHTWSEEPVWVHGDISAGNLLINNNRLDAVIDFGQLCIGDPACDLVIAWTLFDAESRRVFHDTFLPDPYTWARARSWALWKALIVMLNVEQTNIVEANQAHRTFENILSEYGGA
ncbi:aminoglycoside phosphotransferase family protein [Salmonella enterica]|nr:phosphotransferase [Salmonella enterica]EGQ1985132.1 aminoglycoside phosphotransferase family protein [Salmonella enterica subsp. enterica serovar Oranienburg]EHA4409537.1 aminoglycoside phosphotransferase family protein [Salmonella enterica subsp. enterica serovar Give]EEG1298172.1 aminoglycoside phosphotransferase family protein [Salmonella enterica]EEI5971206.1 aminoglycoside phosphotransferase family protein [Salmonella enterica]